MKIIPINLKSNEKIAFVSDIHMDTNTPASRIDDIGETCIGKIKDIHNKCIERNVKAVFLEGDVFNRLSVPHQAVNMLGKVLLDYKQSGIQVLSICGNHDLLRNSTKHLDRSPLDSLFSFGLIEHINLDRRVVINKNILITPCDYSEYPVQATPKAKVNILLAHIFYEASDMIADKRHNITKKQVKSLQYDAMFLGHDHEEYPNLQIGKTLIVRNGSLLRGTSHNYNFERKPNFIVLNDIYNITKQTVEKVEIAHKPYKEVASNYVLTQKQETSLSGLKDVLANLAEKLTMSSSEGDDRILEIIKNDTELPNDSRLQLLQYIGEEG